MGATSVLRLKEAVMTGRTLVYVSVWGILWGRTASAQQLPRFDIEATCQTAQALTVEDGDPVQGCMRDEADLERTKQINDRRA
jgi:hypothetical protein